MSDDKDRTLHLLDQAYDMLDNLHHFDNLMEAIRTYLFNQDEGQEPDTKVTATASEDDALLDSHLIRIQKFLSNANALREDEGEVSGLNARIGIAQNGEVVFGNASAETFFNTQFPCPMKSLPLSRDSLAQLTGYLSEKVRNSGNSETLIYLHNEGHNAPCIGVVSINVTAFASDNPNPAVLQLSLSYVDWSSDVEIMVANQIGLSKAESNVLAGLVKGKSLVEIARDRSRSLETIRSQVKAALRKSRCQSVGELVRLASSAAYLISNPKFGAPLALEDELALHDGQARQMSLPDGRNLEYRTYGAKNGYPAIFWHGLVQGPFFTKKLIRMLDKQNLTFYCLSRPLYSKSSGPLPKADYAETVDSDLAFFLKQMNIEKAIYVAHLAGASHAFRSLNHPPAKISGLVVVSGNIPIDEEIHYQGMNRYTKISAVAAKHAPKLFILLANIKFKYFNAEGRRKYLKAFYESSPSDQALLDDPEIFTILDNGLKHIAAQSAAAFVMDGRLQMEDWSANIDGCAMPFHWIHGENDIAIATEFIEAKIRPLAGNKFQMLPDIGQCVIHVDPEIVVSTIRRVIDEN